MLIVYVTTPQTLAVSIDTIDEGPQNWELKSERAG